MDILTVVYCIFVVLGAIGLILGTFVKKRSVLAGCSILAVAGAISASKLIAIFSLPLQ